MQRCLKCFIFYKKTHLKCSGGTCDFCFKNFRNLSLHQCPIQNLQTNLKQITKTPNQCDGCLTMYFSQKYLRLWKGVNLCFDCLQSPQIQQERKHLRNILHCHLIYTHQTRCEICMLQVLNENLTSLSRFELDHINSLTKKYSVGFMCEEGFNIVEILREANKCRVLCISCHSAVTCVETKSGILRSKQITFSEQQMEDIRTRIDDGVYSLFEKYHKNSI
jgi:hypothetical protein